VDWSLSINFYAALYETAYPLQKSLIVQTHTNLIFSGHLLQNGKTEPLSDATICAVVLLVFNNFYNLFYYMKAVMCKIVNTLLCGSNDRD